MTERHSLSALRLVFDGGAQRARDHFDRFEVEHIGKLPRALGDIALYRMGERVHARSGGQTLGHRGHHLGIYHRDDGNVVGIDADELALFLNVGYNVIYGDFRRGPRGGGHGDDGNGRIFRGSGPLEAAHIVIFGVGDYYADSLGGVHGRASADGDEVIRAAVFERLDAREHVLDGGVGLYLAVYKLNRFSRNKFEMAMHRKHLKYNGIKILSAMENIPDSPEGILLESLLEGMNQYYSEELSQKAKRGMRETRMKGKFTGGRVNYGYSCHEQKLSVIDEEAAVLLEIFTDYANGKSLTDIANDLNARGQGR